MFRKSDIRKWIDDSFVLNEDVRNDRFVNGFKKQISNAIQDKFNSGDKHLMGIADEIGFRHNYDNGERTDLKRNVFKGLNVGASVTNDVKNVAEILRGITNSKGAVNFRMLRTMCDNGQTNGYSYNQILRIKDFIDANGIGYIYDRSSKPSKYKFGLSKGADGINTDEFDMNNITDAQVKDWNGNREEKGYTEEEALFYMKKNIIEGYLDKTYGVEFQVPNFPLGNQKVKDALLINFTSAGRCPAWNECLVKHACYAKTNEIQHPNARQSNERKHLMWEAAHNDPQLMHLLHNMLKAYIVDYTKVSKLLGGMLKTVDKTEGADFLAAVGSKNKIDNLININFSDMPQSVLDTIKTCVRVKDIRLNENGDFIGQWLLDAIDEIAGDFRMIGVNTTAYSCRNLNFEGIKNIVINASRSQMKGGAIARYFYALPESMYNSFEDTYVDMNIDKSPNSIGRTPKPLFFIDQSGNKVPNGNYYYKCPCGREDFRIQEGKKKGLSINCYQCHLCYEQADEALMGKMGGNGKFFVFVKAHGTKAGELDKNRENEIIMKVGVPASYEVGGYAQTMVSEEIGGNQLQMMMNDAFNTITDNCIMSMQTHLSEMVSTLQEECKKRKIIITEEQLQRIINENIKKKGL